MKEGEGHLEGNLHSCGWLLVYYGDGCSHRDVLEASEPTIVGGRGSQMEWDSTWLQCYSNERERESVGMNIQL